MTLEIRFAESLEGVVEADWQSLLTTDQPFCSYQFLSAMETSGSLAMDKGWTANHALVFSNDTLVAALPSYIKTNSHGEFVYDWAWADAYERYGLAYYPKILTGVPYSPITGPRLLVKPGTIGKEDIDAVIDSLAENCIAENHSSWHINFLEDADRQMFSENRHPFLFRSNWQFHWQNRGYATFEDFLGVLKSRKRTNIKRERKRVREAGISFECLHGNELSEEQLVFVIRCYRETFLLKGNYPALTPDFFKQISTALDSQFLVMLASRNTTPVAAAIFFRDSTNLYGRYWGATQPVPDLHFELCYYQGIEYCISHGLSSFQPGAGGEYKLSRGFLPVKTWSAHMIREPKFHEAIGNFLVEEDLWLKHYYEDVIAHSPYHNAGLKNEADDTEAT